MSAKAGCCWLMKAWRAERRREITRHKKVKRKGAWARTRSRVIGRTRCSSIIVVGTEAAEAAACVRGVILLAEATEAAAERHIRNWPRLRADVKGCG